MRHSSSDRTQALWAAALREAAGPLSAYITPPALALDTVSLRARPGGETEDFGSEIEARLDLGRVAAFMEMLQGSELGGTTAYRHEVLWARGLLRGKIHVPRLALGRARNETRGIPVILARRQIATPENLLMSEAFRVCTRCAEDWVLRGGAEREYAIRLLGELRTHESTFPWCDLRTKPRPALSELVKVVEGRIRMGQVESGTVYQDTSILFSDRPNNPTIFEQAATPLSMLITQDPQFEDRVFELLCVAWMIGVLRSNCRDVVVKPMALRGNKKGPLATGWFRGREVSVFFQQSANVLPVPTWIDKRKGKPIRGTPDIVCRVADGNKKETIILDAKNRTRASESEVSYKLMGYKENLGVTPYRAVGIFPSTSGTVRLRRYVKEGHEILLVHVPLACGGRTVQRVARHFFA